MKITKSLSSNIQSSQQKGKFKKDDEVTNREMRGLGGLAGYLLTMRGKWEALRQHSLFFYGHQRIGVRRSLRYSPRSSLPQHDGGCSEAAFRAAGRHLDLAATGDNAP
jgi:hypothetical protein